jgi:hypothetical protein
MDPATAHPSGLPIDEKVASREELAAPFAALVKSPALTARATSADVSGRPNLTPRACATR